MDHVNVLTWRVPDADADALEHATLPTVDLNDTLCQFQTFLGVRGLTYIATCQRILWLLHAEDDDLDARLRAAYHDHGRKVPAPQRFEGFDAFAHLCEVACSLDSMVPGEPQVLGQVKAAVQRCKGAGLHTAELEHLWQYIFRTAKTVRQTALFRGKVSLVPLTEAHIRKALQGVKAPAAAVLGTGEIGHRIIERIRSVRSNTRLHLVSRNLHRAHEHAAIHGATGQTLDGFIQAPPTVDLLVLALRCDEPVLSAEWLERLARRHPITVLDLAMPRNAEPPPRGAPGLRLVQMDDLTRISQRNLAQRDDAREHAKAVLADELDRVRQEYQHQCHASTMFRLTQRFQEVAQVRWQDASLQDQHRKWYDQTVRALLHEAATILKSEDP